MENRAVSVIISTVFLDHANSGGPRPSSFALGDSVRLGPHHLHSSFLAEIVEGVWKWLWLWEP